MKMMKVWAGVWILLAFCMTTVAGNSPDKTSETSAWPKGFTATRREFVDDVLARLRRATGFQGRGGIDLVRIHLPWPRHRPHPKGYTFVGDLGAKDGKKKRSDTPRMVGGIAPAFTIANTWSLKQPTVASILNKLAEDGLKWRRVGSTIVVHHERLALEPMAYGICWDIDDLRETQQVRSVAKDAKTKLRRSRFPIYSTSFADPLLGLTIVRCPKSAFQRVETAWKTDEPELVCRVILLETNGLEALPMTRPPTDEEKEKPSAAGMTITLDGFDGRGNPRKMLLRPLALLLKEPKIKVLRDAEIKLGEKQSFSFSTFVESQVVSKWVETPAKVVGEKAKVTGLLPQLEPVSGGWECTFKALGFGDDNQCHWECAVNVSDGPVNKIPELKAGVKSALPGTWQVDKHGRSPLGGYTVIAKRRLFGDKRQWLLISTTRRDRPKPSKPTPPLNLMADLEEQLRAFPKDHPIHKHLKRNAILSLDDASAELVVCELNARSPKHLEFKADIGMETLPKVDLHVSRTPVLTVMGILQHLHPDLRWRLSSARGKVVATLTDRVEGEFVTRTYDMGGVFWKRYERYFDRFNKDETGFFEKTDDWDGGAEEFKSFFIHPARGGLPFPTGTYLKQRITKDGKSGTVEVRHTPEMIALMDQLFAEAWRIVNAGSDTARLRVVAANKASVQALTADPTIDQVAALERLLARGKAKVVYERSMMMCDEPRIAEDTAQEARAELWEMPVVHLKNGRPTNQSALPVLVPSDSATEMTLTILRENLPRQYAPCFYSGALRWSDSRVPSNQDLVVPLKVDGVAKGNLKATLPVNSSVALEVPAQRLHSSRPRVMGSVTSADGASQLYWMLESKPMDGSRGGEE